MKSNLATIARTVPKATLYRIAGGVAVGSAAAALAFANLSGAYLGDGAGYVFVLLVAALVVWIVAGLARLRIVGFLPSEADHLIPPALHSWIRFWLLARFGLLGSGLLVIVAIIAAALGGWSIQPQVSAFVYVVMVRVFLDVMFGAILNVGLIVGHRRLG